jgi:type IX secretion system PorP/SprF family membrane protein
MKIKLILLLPLVATAATLCAQDYHLSQYDLAPLYLNPALTGRYLGDKNDFRISGNYRTQWQKMKGKPYSTVAVGYDMPYQKWGFGGYIVDNIAGDGNYSTLNIFSTAAYEITQGANSDHHLTAGVQLGIMQKSINAEDLLYESQYTASNGLDPGISSGEEFSDESLLRFDANMGVFYKYRNKNKTARPYLGFSIYHITMPDESFNGASSRVPMRFNVNGGCDLQLNDNFMLVPSVLYMMQGKATEINAGLKCYYDITDTPYNLMLGTNYRVKDAIIVQAGIRQFNSEFRISYDIVPNYLRGFGASRNGFEMGIVYTGGRRK